MSAYNQALATARRGFAIFPIQPGKKLPWKKLRWKQAATTNQDKIKIWSNGLYKNANFAIAPDHRFFVLDVDVKNDAPGIAELRKLKLPATMTVRTPTGGLHLYYRLPEGHSTPLKNGVKWRPGLDIRAAGGYVLAPGSILDTHPDNPYIAIGTHNVPRMAPQHLLDILPYHSSEPQSDDLLDDLALDVPDYAKSSAASSEALSALDTAPTTSQYSRIPDTIPAGGRDDTLYRYACSWRERNYPIAHAKVLMHDLHTRLEQPSGDHFELSTAMDILRRAYKTYKPGEVQRAEEQAKIEAIQPATTEITSQLSEASKAGDVPAKPKDIKAALTRFVYCVEGNQVLDTLKHPAYAAMAMGSFTNTYANINLKNKNEKTKSITDIWMTHTNRQTVDALQYRPKAPMVFSRDTAVHYNTWRESPLAPLAAKIDTPDAGMLQPFFDHLDYIFGEDTIEKELFWQWLAFGVRYPERRPAYGVLIISTVTGIGKSWFFYLLCRLMGSSEVKTALSKELTSEFNTWACSCSFALIHEIFMQGKSGTMETVGSMITESPIMMNDKFVKRRMTDIFSNVLAFTNRPDAVALQEYDRRFFVYRSAALKKAAEDKYFVRLTEWVDTDGPIHLYKYIQQMDLSKFNPYAEPIRTSAKEEMIYINMSLIEQIMRERHHAAIPPFDVDIVDHTRVAEWVQFLTDTEDLDSKATRTIQTVLSTMQRQPLKQDRYSVHGKGQVRLKVIRNWEKWHKASHEELVSEYLRGSMSMNKQGMYEVREK